MSYRHSISFIAITFGLVGVAPAQSFPERPIRLIVAAAPGGANDTLGRMYARRSGPANLNNAISGNSGHNAGPRPVWQ